MHRDVLRALMVLTMAETVSSLLLMPTMLHMKEVRAGTPACKQILPGYMPGIMARALASAAAFLAFLRARLPCAPLLSDPPQSLPGLLPNAASAAPAVVPASAALEAACCCCCHLRPFFMRCPAGVEGLAPVQSTCASRLFHESLVAVLLGSCGELQGMGTGDDVGAAVRCGGVEAVGRAGMAWFGVAGLAAAAFPLDDELFPLPCGYSAKWFFELGLDIFLSAWPNWARKC